MDPIFLDGMMRDLKLYVGQQSSVWKQRAT